MSFAPKRVSGRGMKASRMGVVLFLGFVLSLSVHQASTMRTKGFRGQAGTRSIVGGPRLSTRSGGGGEEVVDLVDGQARALLDTHVEHLLQVLGRGEGRDVGGPGALTVDLEGVRVARHRHPRGVVEVQV